MATTHKARKLELEIQVRNVVTLLRELKRSYAVLTRADFAKFGYRLQEEVDAVLENENLDLDEVLCTLRGTLFLASSNN